jgi:hypothetical protein
MEFMIEQMIVLGLWNISFFAHDLPKKNGKNGLYMQIRSLRQRSQNSLTLSPSDVGAGPACYVEIRVKFSARINKEIVECAFRSA